MNKFKETWTFKNHIAEISRLGFLLIDLQKNYNLSDKLMFNINLVLDELMTNIISYGFLEKKDGEIHVEIEYNGADDTLLITLRDNGVPFDPLLAKMPDLSKSVEDRPIGGLGVYFAKTFARDLKYELKDNHNILTLRFPIN